MLKKKGNMTLGKSLSTSDNSLNFVRLSLATLVIFGHAFPLGGFEPLTIGPFVLGAWHGVAVEGFFVASGYLILASGLRMKAKPFLWRRFLRIYPGYVVALVATAFIFAPLGKLWGGNWQFSESIYFVLKSLTLKSGDLQVHADIPFTTTWNGSLWTLFYEAVAYVGICIFVMIPWVRRHLKVSVVTFAVVMILIYCFIPDDLFTSLPGAVGVILQNGSRLWTFFAIGMLFYIYSHKIPSNLLLASFSALLALALVSMEHNALGKIIILFALAYAVLGLGASLPIRVGSQNDISYGVYVYAFPVQQLLVLAGITDFGWFITSLACLLCTLPLAFLSWKFIEKPAMEYKRLIPSPRNTYVEKIA